MITALELFVSFEQALPAITTILVLGIAYIIFKALISLTKKRLLKKAKTKKQITNIELFSRILKYIVLIFLILTAILSFSGSWAGLGIGIGLLSAAIGFALQKPITGIAAWIMLITKRPFQIGDRIIIEPLKGDVKDITLTHVYLKEVGGQIEGDDSSGRTILIPNSILFEQNIINYSSQKDEIVLDQVIFTVTYESDLNKAIQIALKSAKKHVKEFIKNPKKIPFVRTHFQSSGIDVKIRYFVPVKKMRKLSSIITQELHAEIMKTKEVEFAYPHTEILFKDKKTIRKFKNKKLTDY